MQSGLAVTILATAATIAVAAPRENRTHFAADLTTAAPAEPARGKVEATLDRTTGLLTYRIAYSGLSGSVTRVEFAGPSSSAAPMLLMVTGASLPSPIHGSQIMTAAQIDALIAGQWHINVDTPAHPTGEIAGRLVAKRGSIFTRPCIWPKCYRPQYDPEQLASDFRERD